MGEISIRSKTNRSATPSKRPTLRPFLLVAVLVLVIQALAPWEATPSVAISGTPLIAVGDMADCGNNGGAPASQVSNLLDSYPGSILALGDTAYPNGSASDFNDCFNPIFGRHKNRILPVVGNHEYHTAGASGYSSYFGSAAGPAGQFYYEKWIGGWQVLVLNTNDNSCGYVGCQNGSAQLQWLEARLQAANTNNPNQCRIIAMHHPHWTSYNSYRNQAWLSDAMNLAYQYGTDLVLAGHAHHYERFAPQTPAAASDPAWGFQLMVLGTGGVPIRPTGSPAANSAVRLGTYGITSFTLGSDSFSWRFVGTNGSTLDSGSRTCVNHTPPPTTTTTTTSTTIATTTTAPTTTAPTTTRPTPTSTTPASPFRPSPGQDDAVGAEVYRLYKAVFRRDPDRGGFSYWHRLLRGGTRLQSVADFFAASDEFTQTYGPLSDEAFVDRLYLNVLGRHADPGGRAYWLGVVGRGAKRGDVIVWFSQSREFVAANPFGSNP